MAKQPKGGGITWTNDTWNPIRGCSRVSEGCRWCYAEAVAARFSGKGQTYEGLAQIKEVVKSQPPSEANPWGYRGVTEPRWTGKVAFVPEHLHDPMRWKRPRRVFVNSMSDLFHEKVPDGWIDQIFTVMALAPRHTFQVLTKRPERMREYLKSTQALRVLGKAWELLGHHPWHKYKHDNVMERPFPLPNVWMGVSVEDQKTAEARIPILLNTPAAIRWVSYEPALGPVNFKELDRNGDTLDALTGEVCAKESGCICEEGAALDWIVVGGESGPHARPMHPDWVRSVHEQCESASVPFFLKQWGEWVGPGHDQFARLPTRPLCCIRSDGTLWTGDEPDYASENADCLTMKRVGKHAAGRELDGRTWDEYPQESPSFK